MIAGLVFDPDEDVGIVFLVWGIAALMILAGVARIGWETGKFEYWARYVYLRRGIDDGRTDGFCAALKGYYLPCLKKMNQKK